MIELKGNDPAPHYGLASHWVDENGEIQTNYHIWIQNRPNNELEYYGKPKGWMPEHRKHGKWAVKYDDPIIIDEPYYSEDEFMVENPLDEFDPALVDEDENMMPDAILTQQDLINQDAYYLGYGKHMIEAHQRYDHKKWWQWWIRRDEFPRYPIEKEPETRDKYGRIYITWELYEKIQKWDEEIDRKKKSRLF